MAKDFGPRLALLSPLDLPSLDADGEEEAEEDEEVEGDVVPEAEGFVVPVEEEADEVLDDEEALEVGDAPEAALAPKPTRSLSKSKTEYTFFKNTSPSNQVSDPNACRPMMFAAHKSPFPFDFAPT